MPCIVSWGFRVSAKWDEVFNLFGGTEKFKAWLLNGEISHN